MQVTLRPFQQAIWSQWLYLRLLCGNILLILIGAIIVPSTLHSLNGLSGLSGAVSMQIILALLAQFGPWSFRHCQSGIGISVIGGIIFALLYLIDIVVDFMGGSDPINIYGLFLGVGGIAGFAATFLSHQWRQGVLVAIWALVIGTTMWSAGVMIINYVTWGSHQQYLYWQGDGAIDDFHRSGETDLYAFLLQDMQGALFFHPLLSVVLGALSGLITSSIALGLRLMQRHFLSGRT